MSDSEVTTSFDLVNQLKMEIKSTLDQVSKMKVENIATKVNALQGLMDLTRGVAVFETIDRRITLQAEAGNNLAAALHELSSKEASDFVQPLLEAWKNASIQ
jgi:hypothetical protein